MLTEPASSSPGMVFFAPQIWDHWIVVLLGLISLVAALMVQHRLAAGPHDAIGTTRVSGASGKVPVAPDRRPAYLAANCAGTS